MLESKILDDVKDVIGPMVMGDGFNTQILALIESTLLQLDDIGCLKPIHDKLCVDSTWDEIIQPPKSFLSNQESYSVYSAIISYVGFRVQLLFDPPANSSIKDTKEKIANELFWRIHNFYEYA